MTMRGTAMREQLLALGVRYRETSAFM